MKLVRESIRGLQRFVFPRNCPCCQVHLMNWEKDICKSCSLKLPTFQDVFQSSEIIQTRLMGRVVMQQAFSLMRFYKGGPAQKILHAIKYNHKSTLAVEMGKRLGQKIKDHIFYDENTFIVSVPLHPFKLQMRGFNQSEKIAEGITAVIPIPILTEALFRSQFHISQTQKGKEARWEEIQNDFYAKMDEVRGRDIILVDDVCTSGSTIEACAKALIEKDVKSISLLTLALAGENYR